jgi:hypothetical protein
MSVLHLKRIEFKNLGRTIDLRVLVGLGRSGKLVAFILLEYHVMTPLWWRVRSKKHRMRNPEIRNRDTSRLFLLNFPAGAKGLINSDCRFRFCMKTHIIYIYIYVYSQLEMSRDPLNGVQQNQKKYTLVQKSCCLSCGALRQLMNNLINQSADASTLKLH